MTARIVPIAVLRTHCIRETFKLKLFNNAFVKQTAEKFYELELLNCLFSLTYVFVFCDCSLFPEIFQFLQLLR